MPAWVLRASDHSSIMGMAGITPCHRIQHWVSAEEWETQRHGDGLRILSQAVLSAVFAWLYQGQWVSLGVNYPARAHLKVFPDKATWIRSLRKIHPLPFSAGAGTLAALSAEVGKPVRSSSRQHGLSLLGNWLKSAIWPRRSLAGPSSRSACSILLLQSSWSRYGGKPFYCR